jgi:hypothetical protein
MTSTEFNFDATKPFYAWIGAADLAVEKLRGTATEVQERDLRAFAAQVRTQVSEAFDDIVDELQDELGSLPKRVESFLDDFPKDPRDLPKSLQLRFAQWQEEAVALRERVESRVDERATSFRSDVAKLVEEYAEAVEELAVRGRALVAKLRDDSISGDVEIIDQEAEVVKDVSPVVEKAAADAAAAATAFLVEPVAPVEPAAKKKPATKKAPAPKKPSA